MRRKASFNRIMKTNFKYQTKEFFSNSTLHGVSYIAEEGRPFLENFIWFCFVAIGAVAAFVIIASLWEKFQTNPTITGLDTDSHEQKLNFPTVIICPLEPYNETALNNTAYGHIGSHSENSTVNIPMLKALMKLSYENIDEASQLAANIPNSMFKNWNEKGTLREWVFSIADNCESVIESCKFKGSILAPCCDKFKPIYSERGFCHSFNARHYGTNISEVKSKSFDTIAETDTSWALEMRLKKQSKVYMHSIDEVFSYDFRHQFTWEYSQSIDILISMKETYTTKDVEELSIAQRKCIFPDSSDYKITYYNNDKYSLSACTKECRMKIAIDKCKCIPPFYAPVNMGNYKHCELKDLSCLSRYAGNITNIMKCSKCELSCFNIVYDIEKISLTVKNNSAEARINIEFLTWPIIRYKREILFGYVDLLVSFGGIAGLFLGFSLLSGIELFYYFTVRACCMMYKNREKLYEMREEEDSRPPTNYDMSLRTKFKSLKQQNMTDIQMVLPVASAYNRSSYSSSVSNDRFIVNERPLAIPSMNIKTRQDSNIIQPAIVKIFKINKHLLNNRVKRSMNELQSNYGDKQASSSTQVVIPTTKFQRFSNATHTTKIKPLDANYKRQRLRIFDEEGKDEINLVYHGYLP